MASPRAVSIRIGVCGVGANAPADLQPVDVRQHQIEHQRVERLAIMQGDAG